MTTLARLDPARFTRLAHGLVVAVAVSLPWSTSATSILVVLWLLAVIPTLDWPSLRRELLTPAGGLPVLLVALGLLGMLWADVPLRARWDGVESFFKLLAIPLLFVQFRRSDRGEWVFGGYAISCVVLLLLSVVLVLWPNMPLHFSNDYGVPVKNAASQSGVFTTCIFGLLFLAYDAVLRRRWLWVLGFVAVILAMLADIVFVATGRTALVVILVLLVLFAVKQLNPRGILILLAAAIAVGAVGWFSSSYLRVRTETIWTDLQTYETTDARTSSGERAEFAKKSIAFIREAPIIGHGTGTIHALFTKAAAGPTGAAGVAAANPHNQTFAVAIQLGAVGALVLWAMWIAHLWLFRGAGLAEWIGFVVVVQNIVGSLFNSHLFDFLQGWVYVVGVGVAGGMALKHRLADKPPAAP
jgi:O-antigen ligase